MAQTIENTAAAVYGSATSHAMDLVIGSGTGRKVYVAVGTESSFDVTGVDYNGTAGSLVLKHTYTALTVEAEIWEVSVPDALGAGTYSVNVAHSGASRADICAWQTLGSGAVEGTDSGEAAGGATTVVSGAGMTVTDGAAILAIAVNAASSPLISSWGGGLVARAEPAGNTSYHSAFADVIQSGAGAVTPSATFDVTTGQKVIVAISVASSGTTTYPQNRRLLLGIG